MRTLLLLIAGVLSSAVALSAGRIESRITTLSDIRHYQSQLQHELDKGRMRSVPARTKTSLTQRSDALTQLLDSPTAASNETELAHIGEQFVKFQDAVDAAALQVVICRRTAHVASRIGKVECITVEERERLREFSRAQMDEALKEKVYPFVN